MPLSAVDFFIGGPIKAADINQFYTLFTGTLTDQPVTFANTLTVGGSQSDASVPLRVSSTGTGTARVIEARTLQADANPVFGVSRLGVLSFGAGGGTATDTTITRSGANQLTFSGGMIVTTGGLTVTAGGLTVTAGGLTVGGTLAMTDAVSKIVPGATSLSFRDNADSKNLLTVKNAGNVQIGSGTAHLATTATDGYLCITSCAGAPTGVPTGNGAGSIAMQYDASANHIYFYAGGWRSVAVA